MSLQSIQPLDDTAQRVYMQRRNEREVEYLLNRVNLPAPTVIARPEGVHVMVADVDDLGEWLMERGGEIHRSPVFEGVEMWTLHTSTEPRENGSFVRVLVSVPVPAGELVMHWIREAVKEPARRDAEQVDTSPVPFVLTDPDGHECTCGEPDGGSTTTLRDLMESPAVTA